MSKRPVELPNIEDATLRACLAPLAEAIAAGCETVKPFPRDPVRRPPDRQPGLDRQALPDRQSGPDRQAFPERQPGLDRQAFPGRQPGLDRDAPPGWPPSAEQPLAPAWRPAPVARSRALPPSSATPHGTVRHPATLVEWQALAAQEFGIFGMVQQLLDRTDTDLANAALDFPEQVRQPERFAGQPRPVRALACSWCLHAGFTHKQLL